MRLALIGSDADALEVALAAARSAGHQLVWAFDLGRHAAAVRAAAPGIQVAEHWEGLLSGAVAEAVIVGRGGDDEVRADQLRKLVQANVPLLISHPIHASMLLYYELDMIRQESNSVMLPFPSSRSHPVVARLAELFATDRSSGLGGLEQLVIERSLGQRNRRAVLDQFVRDTELARAVCSELTSVTGMSSGGTDHESSYANLGVQMSGPSGVLVRWSVGPAQTGPDQTAPHQTGPAHTGPPGRFIWIGSRGKAILEVPADRSAWTLDTPADAGWKRQTFADWNPANEALARLADAIAGRAVRPSWVDAAQAMELADAVEQSLERGRLVQLHFGGPSEQGTL
ncbi:MAG: hypothetical protein WD278_11340, partial [Pirellulales bacterium]